MVRLWRAPRYEFVTRRTTELVILDRNSSPSPSRLGKLKTDPHQNQNNDRLSSLSDDIIHHIFSFLESQAFVAIGMVSKNCRRLFMSSPYLSFSFVSGTYVWPLVKCNCDRFCVFLLKYFTLRERSLGIKRLYLRWHCHNDSPARYAEAMHLMMKFHVEELDIELENDHHFLPQVSNTSILWPWILNCQKLKSLKLDLDHGLFQFPLVSLNLLEVLSLSQVRISESDDFPITHWIFSCCPLLKKLHLEDVTGMRELCLNSEVLEEFKLTMLSPLRENFTDLDISTEKLKSLYMYIKVYPDGFESVRIKAPSLQSLKWMGLGPRQCSFAPSTCLLNCVLDLKPRISSPPLSEWIVNLVDGIKKACQALQINVLAIEDLFVRGYLPIEFPHLHHLEITVGKIIDAKVPAVFSFLQGLPNLQKLSMIYDTSSVNSVTILPITGLKYPREFDFLSESTNLLSDHLREIEIAFSGFKAEIGMVEHLLKHSRGLKKMFIYCSKPYYDVLVTKIRSFETASSQVAISISYDEVYNGGSSATNFS